MLYYATVTVVVDAENTQDAVDKVELVVPAGSRIRCVQSKRDGIVLVNKEV